MKDMISGICMVLGMVFSIIALALGIAAPLARASCLARWEDSGFHVRWGFFEGCRVSKDGVVWLGERRYMNVDTDVREKADR